MVVTPIKRIYAKQKFSLLYGANRAIIKRTVQTLKVERLFLAASVCTVTLGM